MGAEGLGERGSELYAALIAFRSFDPAGEVLVVEACRIPDRLEQLDSIIAGKGVLQLLHLRHMDDETDDERSIVMTVDGVLAESRQQQNTLRQIVATLGLARAEERGDGDTLAAFLDELRAT